MLRFPVQAKSLRQLKSMAEPQPVEGGQSEALPWTFYDTATYVSGTTTRLELFTQTRSNNGLSNLNGRGLPTPQYFEIYGWTLDVLRAPGDVDVFGDVWGIINGTGATGAGTPTFAFDLADKITGPFPLRMFHGLGGISGYTTRTAQEYANNSFPDGGFWLDGSIVIPPNQTFKTILVWPSAVTLSGDVDLQIGMTGVLHRRVL